MGYKDEVQSRKPQRSQNVERKNYMPLEKAKKLGNIKIVKSVKVKKEPKTLNDIFYVRREDIR